MLHLTNGDCAVPSLRAAGVEGEIVTWADVLHHGPLPDRASRRSRAERLETGEPLLLWFEADLFASRRSSPIGLPGSGGRHRS